MVRILISSDSDIYIQNANGRTPLYLAFEYQQANNDKRRRLQNSNKIINDDDEIDLIVNALQKLE